MDDPLWYKDAIFYEVHVRAFQDGNHDGVGDFVGLTQRLDYLADLGITAVWLLPFTRSPLKDDGYDIADYTSVHPDYGTLDDFRTFLDKAHSVGIRVITELVINHTSDQHPWFQRARRAPPESVERNFYVWTDDPERYAGVPLMFPDFEISNWAWDPIARQYYWHRFYSHQPDLNFDNPAVWDSILPVVDFWFAMGVDGMRLDAVPYLIEREGTACEHLPETHQFLKTLRKHVESTFPGRMFLAEANAWPDEMVAYFGEGDECQMAFHFPLMPRLFMALQQENRFPIVDILAQTPPIPPDCQWCLFLRNHDELTLAMVTDEERDAMYSAYTRDRQARLFLGIRHRLAPLLRNDRRRIELMNAILFSLPGTPVVYYGDEIGMGDNIYLGDRNGVRTPMQWSDDRNAGFSRANSQKLYSPVIVDSEYHYESLNVDVQQNNPSSLLWWMKRMIALRKRCTAFGRGDFHLLEPQNSKVLAYVRRTESECLLIVANLSRFVQNVQFDLSSYAGLVPEELFGRTRFPVIREAQPYGLTLGPHGFYWFELRAEGVAHASAAQLPLLAINDWPALVRGRSWEALARLLMTRQSVSVYSHIVGCRLMEQKGLVIEGLNISLFICRLEYSTNLFETLFQMLALVPEDRFQGADALPSASAIARTGPPANFVLCDPIALPEYRSTLLTAFVDGSVLSMSEGDKLVCVPFEGFRAFVEDPAEIHPSNPIADDLGQSTFTLSRGLMMRTFRRPDEGLNPDVEVGEFLRQQGFKGFAPIVGTIEYHRRGLTPMTLGALHGVAAHQGDAWQLMLEQASRFFDLVVAQSTMTVEDFNLMTSHGASGVEVSEQWEVLVAPFLHTARALGAFTAQLHLTLGSAPSNSPLAAAAAQQRSFYQTLRNTAGRLHSHLTEADSAWPEETLELVRQVRSKYQAILNRIRGALDPKLGSGRRIRCHGNYRLKKLLASGQEFILTDFEGMKDRPIGERRIKQSPLYDVATLLGSVNYAVNSVRLEFAQRSEARPRPIRLEDRAILGACTSAWFSRLEHELFSVYTAGLESSGLLPGSADAQRNLLELSLLYDAFDNAERDLFERPERAVIPLSMILGLIERYEPSQGNSRY